MTWQIAFSKESLKFITKNNIPESDIEQSFRKVVQRLQGQNLNLDIKRLKGKWQGFYRLREGKKRLIFSIDFDTMKIFIDRIDFRGDVYK
jgi:mRNA interferase RelE/StbE